MNRLFNKICQIVCCLMLSILLHLLFFKAIGLFGPWDLSSPVNSPLTAYLAETDSKVPATARSTIPEKKVFLPKQSVADEDDVAAPESASSQSPQPESVSALNVESPSREAGLHTASQ
ncbi:MAG: hypothetical protein HXX17_12160, partial [Geobacteraceae bacterium]|nr:hypothetical protein [Geobacteraceae bacterium]